MAVMPRHIRINNARYFVVLVMLVVALVFVDQPRAMAAEVSAANYRARTIPSFDYGRTAACRSWSADGDDAGRLYAACPSTMYPTINEFDINGNFVRATNLPAGYLFNNAYRMRDIAVAPNGNTLYVSMGPNVDQPTYGPDRHYATGTLLPAGVKNGAILRLTRTATGNWTYDPTFRAGPFLIGTKYWSARNVDVDASGRIYVSANAYVYELSPITGGIVSAFGGATTDGVNGPWLSGIDVAQGIAVARNGASILVVEQKYHMVQRWVRLTGGGWKRDTSFLIGVPNAEDPDRLCLTNTHLQSPYDVGVDAAGDIYVYDVSCRRIQRYNKTGGFIQTVWSSWPDGDLYHGFGVGANGNIINPERELLVQRLDPPVIGGGANNCTDRYAPVIQSVTAPASSKSRTVLVTANATDDCTGVTHVKVSGDVIGGTTAWMTGTSINVRLGGWNGTKRLLLTVRDGKGRFATRAFNVRLALVQPPLVARTRIFIAGTGCASVNPMSRVGGASAYLLADRCARVRGRIMSASRSGRSWTIKLVIPALTARKLYTNAVGPVALWVVTDSRSRIVGTPRRGRSLTTTGSLVATRNRTAVYAIPTDITRTS